jgi:predicted nucleotidyltransferase
VTTKTLDSTKINISADDLAAFCRRHHIRQLALFGSVLRDDFDPESDVDILIEFEPDVRIGYFQFFGIERELAALLQRDVDLFTPDSLRRFARNEALRTRQVIYAR